MPVKVASHAVPLAGCSADWAVITGAHDSPAQILTGNPAGALAADERSNKGNQQRF